MKARQTLRYCFSAFCFACIFLGLYAWYDENRVVESAQILAMNEEDVPVYLQNRQTKTAWIKINGTNINYPIVQGKDNEYYLNHNVDGKVATAGSIFLDYRNKWSDDFLIIYGHRMSGEQMFGEIVRYRDEGFWNSHRSGRMWMNGDEYELHILAFAVVSVVDASIYTLPKRADNVWIEMQDKALWLDEKADINGRKLVLLSTCDRDAKKWRNVLLAVLR